MATHFHRVGAILVIARDDGDDVGGAGGSSNACRDGDVEVW
jgi:hypothetical protein